MNALRIAIVCYPGIGGSGIVATELGKTLARRGHNIHFVSYDVPQRLESVDGRFNFHHVDVPVYPLFRFRKKYRISIMFINIKTISQTE